MPEIVTVAERPDLIASVAPWIWEEWGRRKGRTLEQVASQMATNVPPMGPQHCFVLLDDGIPAGTSRLVPDDLDERPDLSPWLAGVFVPPQFRGRGHAVRLVRAVEAACVAQAIQTLWLHTEFAAGLYARLGWKEVGPADDWGHAVTLMRRDLGG